VPRGRIVAAALVAVLVSSGTVVVPPAYADTAATTTYKATIRRTAFGVPHVLADSIANAGFGQGWAYAEDRFCDLMDQVVKVRSQRARYFGPGPGDINIATDLAFQALGLQDRARQQFNQLTTEERDLLNGYVAGFNALLTRTGPAHVPGWCAGMPWVGPITAIDVLAYQRDIALFASGDALVGPIALAQPPGAAAASAASRIGRGVAAEGIRRLADLRRGTGAIGSNGWALGADRSVSGQGMLVANPHFPWQGELRFWESQVTVPGTLNVYGASLGGLPGVEIGFTDKVAWTHTIATGTRLTFYSLKLVPGAPTKYYVDGRPEAMTSKTVTIQVDVGGGVLQPVSQTMYFSRYGPMLDLSPLTDPPTRELGWTTTSAITYRDANIDNDRLLRQWLNMAKASDVNGLRDAIGRDQGIPWVNTIATDSRGNAFYTDSSATPNLSASGINEWLNDPFGLGILDGSKSSNAWVVRSGARSPGLVPFSAQPKLTRRDYVFNANDSHWVPNEFQFLTGFNPLQGPEQTPLTLRSRQNVKLINGAEPGTVDSRKRFDVPGLGTAILSGLTLTATELAASVVAACQRQGTRPVNVDGTLVDISPGCAVLARWDRREELSSSGAALWRETIDAVLAANPDAASDAGALFGVPFTVDDPINTPRGPASDSTPVLVGLGRAMQLMRRLGFDLAIPLKSLQYTEKNGERIPVPGSTESIGVANDLECLTPPGSSLEPSIDCGAPIPGTFLTAKGYVVNYGTSFLLTLGYTANGPAGKCLLTFSESADPASPHFADQTRLFTRKQLRDCEFSDAAISADPQLATEVVVVVRIGG
jgi:acyl-homoserine-lactone acylase